MDRIALYARSQLGRRIIVRKRIYVVEELIRPGRPETISKVGKEISIKSFFSSGGETGEGEWEGRGRLRQR